MRLALHSFWLMWAGVSLVKKEMTNLMRAPTLSDRSMKFNFPDNQGEDEPKRSLPKPNAKMKQSVLDLSFTEEEVRGLIANPVYAGVGPFPKLVTDEQWIRAAAKAIRVNGPEQFLVNMLHVLRQSLKDAQMLP